MPSAAGMPGSAGIPPGLAGPMFGSDNRSADGNAFAQPSAPDFGDLPAGINVEEARCGPQCTAPSTWLILAASIHFCLLAEPAHHTID